MAEIIRIYNENPNPREITKVVKTLRNGGLVIYPTDTVYGLGCDITNNSALAYTFPSDNSIRVKSNPTAAATAGLGKPLTRSNTSLLCKSSKHN